MQSIIILSKRMADIKRQRLLEKVKTALPGLTVDLRLLTDEQIIILLLNEDLKSGNLSYQQIEIRYSVSRAIARKLKFIVRNC
jgi:hypothetical protein